MNCGDLIKELRKSKGLTQDELAERVSSNVNTISRIENNKLLPSLSLYTAIMQLLGASTVDYCLAYLNKDERIGYTNLLALRRTIRDGHYCDTREIIESVDGIAPFDSGIYHQFLIYAKVMVNDGISHEVALSRLYEAIKITKGDFSPSKVDRYLLTYNEITIICEIATRFSYMGKSKDAISLLKAVKSSMDRNYIDENEKANTYPILLHNLSFLLGKSGRYEESIEMCETGLKVATKYNRMKIIPDIHYNIACGLHLMGKNGWHNHLAMAYYSALAMGDEVFATTVKNDAKKSFGIAL